MTDELIIKDKKGRKRFLLKDDEIIEFPLEEIEDDDEGRESDNRGNTKEAV